MKRGHAGIPTRYAGVNFRSRLEARWAAFFDLVGAGWEYEPYDLCGYIPDFIVETSSRSPRPGSLILVEVKPVLEIHVLDEHFAKIQTSGWKRPCAVVGARLFSDTNRGVIMGKICVAGENGWSAPWPWPLLGTTLVGATQRWREANNRVQWRAAGRMNPPHR